MQTGEGKTLTAALPVYLNALTGKGVHLVTANPYLARRDMEEMGEVYKFMGLSVGLVEVTMDNEARKEAYAADITYTTNSALGFDYMRDNLKTDKADQAQRGHNFVIVDEVDSVLLDEAQTPMIIAEKGPQPSPYYKKAQKFVEMMRQPQVFEDLEDWEDVSGIDADCYKNSKSREVGLTAAGIKKAERFFGVRNLGDPENADVMEQITLALRANYVLERGRDYLVETGKNGKKEIVLLGNDRRLQGRRYSDGLHSAVEAKEGLELTPDNVTKSSISVKNLYGLYDKVAGMSGTAKSDAAEFKKLYGLDVLEVPRHLEKKRVDNPDLVYRTKAEKNRAVISQIVECHKKGEMGQPVLVVTNSIEECNATARKLREMGIEAQVLTAENESNEARIIAQAGRPGAVTIATNIAGRGTDIKLGGNAEFLAEDEIRGECSTAELLEVTGNSKPSSPRIAALREKYQSALGRYSAMTKEDAKKVRATGGLFVLSTGLGKSSRVDGQIQGRSGRQGDPGETQRILSLEDEEIVRYMGRGAVAGLLMRKGGVGEGVAFREDKVVDRFVRSAQARAEDAFRKQRERVAERNDILGEYREAIFAERQRVLEGEDISGTVQRMVERAMELAKGEDSDAGDVRGNGEGDVDEHGAISARARARNAIEQTFKNSLMQTVSRSLAEMSDEVKRSSLLEVLDENWAIFQESAKAAQRGMYLVGYAERDPMQEYREQLRLNRERMLDGMSQDLMARLMRTVRAVAA